mmetsp:Transcript_65591/g.156802  ORF Transcript_65591/g.156802 Transcript_65591/m.156802 type:complete len:262 (-) Transcript_65591:5192-5977(-)
MHSHGEQQGSKCRRHCETELAQGDPCISSHEKHPRALNKGLAHEVSEGVTCQIANILKNRHILQVQGLKSLPGEVADMTGSAARHTPMTRLGNMSYHVQGLHVVHLIILIILPSISLSQSLQKSLCQPSSENSAQVLFVHALLGCNCHLRNFQGEPICQTCRSVERRLFLLFRQFVTGVGDERLVALQHFGGGALCLPVEGNTRCQEILVRPAPQAPLYLASVTYVEHQSQLECDKCPQQRSTWLIPPFILKKSFETLRCQ